MEKIHIQYAPDGKSIADKIAQALTKNNFAVSSGINTISDNNLPEILIAVFSVKADSTQNFISVLDLCQEKDVTVIPFVSTQLDKTATQRYFLNDHIWIDNIETVFTSSVEDLLDLLTKNYAVLADRKLIKKEKENKKQRRAAAIAKNNKQKSVSTNTNKENLYKNICIMLSAVVVILLAIIMFGPKSSDPVSQNKSQNAVDLNSNIRKSENPLLGTWQLTAYVDNQFRATRQDSLDHQAAVNQLLNVAQLQFTSDRKFVRRGFSETTDRGFWEYDPSNHYLKLQPEGDTKFAYVQLQELTDQKMIIIVSEKVENLDIITKMTFTKIAN